MDDIPDEAVNPMQAIQVLLDYGYGRLGEDSAPALMSFDSNAVVGTYNPYLSAAQLQQDMILARNRDRIDALSVALALDDSNRTERFSDFPPQPDPQQPQVTVKPAPAAASGSGKAASGGQAAVNRPVDPPSLRSAELDDDSATQPVASKSIEDDMTPEERIEYRRETITQLNRLLESMPDPQEEIGTAILAASLSTDQSLPDDEPAYPYADEDAEIDNSSGETAGTGFHGLIDLTGPDETDPALAGGTAEPGSAVSNFGTKMAIFTVLLLIIASFVKSKGNPLARLRQRSMKVLETVSLGPGRQIMIVETQGANLVLGVTGGGINLLDRLPAEASGEQYRENVQDIISRESAVDESSWKKRPALDLLEGGLSGRSAGSDGVKRSRSISVSELRRVRGSQPETSAARPDRHTELVSRVRSQLERIRS